MALSGRKTRPKRTIVRNPLSLMPTRSVTLKMKGNFFTLFGQMVFEVTL